MPISLSPSVDWTEQDLTLVAPAVATSGGAFAGTFRWGPVNQIMLLDSENNLVARTGRPLLDSTGIDFFVAANFLQYGNNLKVVRVVGDNAVNASTSALQLNVVLSADGVATEYVLTPTVTYVPDNVMVVVDGETVDPTTYTVETFHVDDVAETFDGDGNTTDFELAHTFVDEPTTVLVQVDGNDLVEGVDFTTSFNNSTKKLTIMLAVAAAIGVDNVSVNTDVADNKVKIIFDNAPALGDDNLSVHINTNRILNEVEFEADTDTMGSFIGKFPGAHVNGIEIVVATAANWMNISQAHKNIFMGMPVGDEMHVAVIDATGNITNSVGTLLERYDYVSTDENAKFSDGTTAYYKKSINNRSAYIWASGNIDDVASDGTCALAGGIDDNNVTDGQRMTGFDLFADAERVDVSFLLAGAATLPVILHLLSITDSRKDCVAFFSPLMTDVVNNPGDEVTDMTTFRALLPSTSYAFFDGNWKYQYDRYNDTYRWLPLNGDIAGLCARTDLTNDPWWSPAGYNRGQIKNTVRLAFNPTKPERDEMYKNGINPVISTQGQGTILLGDKTLLSRPSAFQHINVRRLFIVLEKTIATASKYILFEFNDQFTRAQFRNLVEPYLRDVQGRRGIVRFNVVCNETNNTAQVINENRFVADIFIDPNRSINNIQLNFIAVPSGFEFEEVEFTSNF